MGFWSMKINRTLSTNSVKEAIRIVDAENALIEYKGKCKHNANFIDLEARRAFNSKEVTLPVVKCTHGFNHYCVRDAIINNNLTGNECPYCSQLETWEYVIKCNKVRMMQREFVKETTKELLK